MPANPFDDKPKSPFEANKPTNPGTNALINDIGTKKVEPIKPTITKGEPVETAEAVEPVIPPYLTRKAEILMEYGGLESNIPIDHEEYWKLKP